MSVTLVFGYDAQIENIRELSFYAVYFSSNFSLNSGSFLIRSWYDTPCTGYSDDRFKYNDVPYFRRNWENRHCYLLDYLLNKD